MAQFAGSDSLFEKSGTHLYIEEEDMGEGILVVREDALKWSSGNGGRVISLNYPDIAIHAVSRDTAVFPYRPCVLLLHCVPDVDSDADQDSTQFRLALPDPEQLDELFSAISECQRLYPDSELSSEEEEGESELPEEGNYYTTPEGLQSLTEEGESVLRHLESILHIEVDESSIENGCGESNQFEDAADSS